MNIIKFLYEKYYLNNTNSKGVSSHWTQHGIQTLHLIDGNVEIKGMGGFGDYVSKSLKSYIRNFIHIFLTTRYRNKYIKSNHIDNLAKSISSASNRLHLLDSAKHAIVLEQLISNKVLDKVKVICVIGDGYGYFGNLLSKYDSNFKIIFVNLGKQLIFDAQITQNINTNSNLNLLSISNINEDLMHFNFLEAENYHLIAELNIDLFINIASMQEMNKMTVDNDFTYMRASKAPLKFFYCCNRIHKVLPDGEEIIFDNYPWKDSQILFEEIPNWYMNYTAQKPPFWRPYDGLLKVRLVTL